MAIGASQHGGTHQHHAVAHSPLSAAEHHAATQVLAKLGLSSTTDFNRASAEGSDSVTVGAGQATLFSGAGHDTLAHGSAASLQAGHGAGADKLVAGSSHVQGPSLHVDNVSQSGHGALFNNKLGVAGTTAASVKDHASHAAKATTAKMTISDKTSIHVTGVSAHDLIKGHGSDK